MIGARGQTLFIEQFKPVIFQAVLAMSARRGRVPSSYRYVPQWTNGDGRTATDYDDWMRVDGSLRQHQHSNGLISVLTVLGAVMFSGMLVLVAAMIDQIDGLPGWAKLMAIMGYFLASLCLFVACIVGIFVRCGGPLS